MPRTGARGGPETRARILAAANRLFLDRGYDAVTVAEVAGAAGVSSVTVFNHFARKEDLFFDRAGDAEDVLREAIRGREVDVLDALEAVCLALLDERSALAGVDERSVPFFRTVAASPALLARSRELVAGLQRLLADELAADPTFEGDATLFAALVVAGYVAVFTATARGRLAGEPTEALVAGHRSGLDRLFRTLRSGVETRS